MNFGRKKWNRLLRVNTVGWLTIIVTVLGFSAFATSSSVLLWKANQSIDIWESYKTINDEKRRSFAELVEYLGYGGFIHNYKNYILRKDNELVARIDNVLGSSMGAVERYRLTDINVRESEALNQISQTITAYGAQLREIQGLIGDDKQAELIDKIVRIDDEPALKALSTLKNITTNSKIFTSGHTRLDLIGEIRFSLGYGGMIHDFKNYVLRRDDVLVSRINDKIADARNAIVLYRSLVLSAEEQAALDTIDATLRSYKSKFATIDMRDNKLEVAPESLDEAVRVDDRLALDALDVLDQYAAQQVQLETNIMEKDLVTVTRFATAGLVIAVVTGLLVLLTIYAAMMFFKNNLSTRKRLTESLSTSEKRLEEAQILAGVGNFETDLVTKENHWSPQMYQIVGLNLDEVIPGYESFRQFVHPDDRQVLDEGKLECTEIGESSDMTLRGVRSNGEVRYLNINFKSDKNEHGKLLRVYGTVQDITEPKLREIELQETKDKVERLAYLDEMTGLSNRARCQTDLSARFENLNSKSEFSMIHVDIDNFKRINDTLGHPAGDALLKEIGRRMTLLSEESEFAKAYRWGGDEFVVVAENADDKVLASFCEELTDLISVPVQYGETTMWTTASIGVARYPDDGKDLHSLMVHSDLAMYKSKEKGRDRFEFFTKEMKVKIDEESRIEDDLRKAIDDDQLFLIFQPQLDVKTRQVKGVEALLRWRHPQRGVLTPGDFLDVIENTSLAPLVGRIVIQKALTAARSWLDQGYYFGRIGLNVSPKHLKLRNFLEDLQSEMKKHDVAPEYLAVEVLESIFLDDPDVDNVGMFEQLHKDGVHVQLDDFGTGYASLSHLSTLPVDAIKIDTSFITQMDKDKKKAVVVHALIDLAHILEIDAICEGVETAAQLEMLEEIGHCSVQGYYMCRPKSFTEISDWLRDPSKREKHSITLDKAS